MTAQEAIALIDHLLQSANKQQKLTDIQSHVFLETWEGHSYQEIADRLLYEHDYIKQVGSHLWRNLSQILGEKVSKQNLQAVLRHYQQSSAGIQDWGEAIDVSYFYNRLQELETLETWISGDSTRAIGIFGIGGIGKTSLSVKLAQQIQSKFEFAIWRSLQQAPTLDAILSDILPILTNSSAETNHSIHALMEQLRQKRCLLIFDNLESILQAGNRSGQYQQGYEDYRQLFARIADEPHQSCLILTGREQPGGFAVRSGENLPVRSLKLFGLSPPVCQQILADKGLKVTLLQCRDIVNYFGGNPLALKLAATTIQTLFGGDIHAFLVQGNTVFSDLWDLLDRQFDRLSPLQQQIMYWLAINQEAATPAKLKAEILPEVSGRQLMEALEALAERSLIFDERSLNYTASTSLMLQPAIAEYVRERLLERNCRSSNIELLINARN
ncbi:MULTISPECIES: NB-ARC domain-containing protein [unclassified Microcoleus]|uniref:NB-ARC domain-containing protein n=1 Tax=unclassified Microcoleus TaxID=2642155 RepID=UPI001E073C71|nr:MULTISPECIES: NB-ARC domain-containing protein [unclassified Microcoleus]MCC3430296.1 AAA family ATPase [Microcoleus sp. PH2017_04_SCI_O_A]MCC3443526.1 AAA family ATPase [Microcoleus sp. PH2017_03_ELD_O_A]MCC3505852.1 AAA family ATPase [Microcoleus sp. PH2017_19_SFW_U_A]TAE71892.1 MAG: AAA family ATPase [Oscillatoriales cyanobacterium]MCC3454147.1 AAA family ATPase [Microcoleus sp. PH2017_08_TRC_O_A]